MEHIWWKHLYEKNWSGSGYSKTTSYCFIRFQMTENVDTQLKQMSEDLKEIIEHLNETNRTQDTSDPVSYGLKNFHWVIFCLPPLQIAVYIQVPYCTILTILHRSFIPTDVICPCTRFYSMSWWVNNVSCINFINIISLFQMIDFSVTYFLV